MLLSYTVPPFYSELFNTLRVYRVSSRRRKKTSEQLMTLFIMTILILSSKYFYIFVLECVEIEVHVWTGSKGYIRSVKSHISETILPHKK